MKLFTEQYLPVLHILIHPKPRCLSHHPFLIHLQPNFTPVQNDLAYLPNKLQLQSVFLENLRSRISSRRYVIYVI